MCKGDARIESVVVRTDAHRAARELRRRGADKGEAEAIAWARSVEERVFFVSGDKRARRIAGERPPAITAAECVALVTRLGVITRAQARDALTIWDDSKKQHGRPPGWRTFEESFGECESRVERLLR